MASPECVLAEATFFPWFAQSEPLHLSAIELSTSVLGSVYAAIQSDSVRKDTTIRGPEGIGDPTNTDVPGYYPDVFLNRFPLTPAQRSYRFIKPPKGYEQRSSIDTALGIVKLFELTDGSDVGTMVPLSMDAYLEQRRMTLLRKARDSSLLKYEMKKPLSAAELTKLIDQATNITIPLPQNPLFGIFESRRSRSTSMGK